MTHLKIGCLQRLFWLEINLFNKKGVNTRGAADLTKRRIVKVNEQEQSGVNTEVEAPAAGEQQSNELDLESLLFGDQSETGEKEEVAAEPAETEEQVSEAQELPTEDASKAFAAKWSAEKNKLRDEVRSEVMAEIQQQTQTTPQQQAQGAPHYRELSQDELNKLADEFETSPAVVRILHQQQQLLNQQAVENRRMTRMTRERAEYTEAQKFAENLVRDNPSLPKWDDKKIHDYRMAHYKKYGTTLPWAEAYRGFIADAVLSGDFSRQTQQETIKKITERDTQSAPLKPTATPKPTISDLTDEQFDKLRAEVLEGKYKRS